MTPERYAAEIDRLISEMSGEVALNGSHEHASIILERMFSRAKHEVRIVSRSLDPRIYSVPSTMAALGRFLGDKSRTCRVIVEDLEEDAQSRHAFLLLGEGRSNFSVKIVPPKLRQPVNITFALMDHCGFRFEKDDTGTTAITAFGEKKLTPRLISVFEQLWEVSHDLRQSMVAA